MVIIIGFILVIAGIVGCFAPVVPGPPISYLALVLLSMVKGWAAFSGTFMVIMAVLMVVVTLLDYVAFAAGAKRYGATQAGVWCSVAGLLLGTVFGGFIGMFLGAFIGAVAGEIIAGSNSRMALRAGMGVFVGTVFGIGLKLAYCLMVAGVYVWGVF
ncbi:MAG: DUF456 domain-containing protein [Desulfatibacillaceae bacterium]